MKFRVMRDLAPKASKRERWKTSNRCMWCGLQVRYRARPQKMKPMLATREHIVPRSIGGGGGRNIGVSCRRCNNMRRSDTTWVPYRSLPDGVNRPTGKPIKLTGEEYVVAGKR